MYLTIMHKKTYFWFISIIQLLYEANPRKDN